MCSLAVPQMRHSTSAHLHTDWVGWSGVEWGGVGWGGMLTFM